MSALRSAASRLAIACLLSLAACATPRSVIEDEAGVDLVYGDGGTVEFHADDTELRRFVEMLAAYGEITVDATAARERALVTLTLKGVSAIQALDIACIECDHVLRHRRTGWYVEPLPETLDPAARRELARELWTRRTKTARARSLALALLFTSAAQRDGTAEELVRLARELDDSAR